MKTLFTTSLFAVVAMAALTNPALAQRQESGQQKDLADLFIKSAATEEARSNAIDFAVAPIKSERDLHNYMLTKDRFSPLSKLTPDAQERFVRSVRFNEKGVTTYDYSDLRAQLSASDIYNILALFGIQRTIPAIPGVRTETDSDRAIMAPHGVVPSLYPDYSDYRCESRATCTESLRSICTGNC